MMRHAVEYVVLNLISAVQIAGYLEMTVPLVRHKPASISNPLKPTRDHAPIIINTKSLYNRVRITGNGHPRCKLRMNVCVCIWPATFHPHPLLCPVKCLAREVISGGGNFLQISNLVAWRVNPLIFRISNSCDNSSCVCSLLQYLVSASIYSTCTVY